MFITMSEDTYDHIKDFVTRFNYVDYDESLLFIDRTVSYHSNIKYLRGDYVDRVRAITNENLVCKNINMIEQFKSLHEIYAKFDEHELSKLHELQGRDNYSIIDYVLYRMNIKDIDTLSLNMFGIRKLTLNEY